MKGAFVHRDELGGADQGDDRRAGTLVQAQQRRHHRVNFADEHPREEIAADHGFLQDGVIGIVPLMLLNAGRGAIEQEASRRLSSGRGTADSGGRQAGLTDRLFNEGRIRPSSSRPAEGRPTPCLPQHPRAVVRGGRPRRAYTPADWATPGSHAPPAPATGATSASPWEEAPDDRVEAGAPAGVAPGHRPGRRPQPERWRQGPVPAAPLSWGPAHRAALLSWCRSPVRRLLCGRRSRMRRLLC